MTLRLLALGALASLLLCGAQQNRNPRPTLLEVELSARRNDKKGIEIDGKARNVGVHPLKKVVLVYLFVAPDGKVVSKRKAPLETGVLEPGEQSEFLLETPDVARAVWIKVEAQRDGVGLDVKQGAPFPIE